MRYNWIASGRFVAIVIFLSLTLVIFGNALVMQPESHPAPLFFTRTAAALEDDRNPAPLPAARRAADPESAGRPKVRPAETAQSAAPVQNADPIVLAIQSALSDAAYGPVTVDGIAGSETTDAIRRFQLDQGLPVTGKIGDKLISRLISVGAMAQR